MVKKLSAKSKLPTKIKNPIIKEFEKIHKKYVEIKSISYHLQELINKSCGETYRLYENRTKGDELSLYKELVVGNIRHSANMEISNIERIIKQIKNI